MARFTQATMHSSGEEKEFTPSSEDSPQNKKRCQQCGKKASLVLNKDGTNPKAMTNILSCKECLYVIEKMHGIKGEPISG